MSYIDRRVIRKKIHRRIRKKIAGTAERPRLAVYFSNKNVYAQLIDDDAGKTLVAASTVDKEVGHRG
ncbi:MAG: large subunit ribosomal protein L18, partial [Verrucomicrobiales bacterium]